MALKQREDESRKGDNGKVLVVAGSKEYTGSAFLCAMAAASLRSGTDLVTVAAPEKVAWAINAMSPDVITAKMKGDYLKLSHHNAIRKLSSKCDVVVIGPGIGKRKETKQLVAKLMKIKMPKVIDADALKMIKIQDCNECILTPHKKEFEILLKNSKLSEKKKNNFLKKIGNNVILLKGSVDEIYSGRKAVYASGGNSGMTVGGTGDVLAGLCAGFIAQGNNLDDSAYAASKINKKVGDDLKKRIGNGFIASDFLAEIAVEAEKMRK